MMTEQYASRYIEDYAALGEALPGQHLPWMQTFRANALKRFADQGFPSVREEEWRYTNVSALERKRFKPLPASYRPDVTSAAARPNMLSGAWCAVMINGRFAAEFSELSGLPEAVTVTSMDEALRCVPDLVESRLGQLVTEQEHSFVAFTNAWFNDGLFIHVPENTVLERPLQILHFVDQPDALLAARQLLLIDAQAQVSLIEQFCGTAQAYLSASVSEMFIGESADVAFYKIQAEAENAYHYDGLYVQQAARSRLKHENFAFGATLARNDIRIDLLEAADCTLNGLYLGSRRQHIDNHTRINHMQCDGVSRQYYKGVLDQRSRGVFQGRVLVAEDAQRTDSEMQNRNLLLSDDAEADTKPQLEIYADDVKCAHGVTVGQLDEKSLFYLLSRGIREEDARNILTFAFANERVSKIGNRSLHDLVLTMLLQHFPQPGIDHHWL